MAAWTMETETVRLAGEVRDGTGRGEASRFALGYTANRVGGNTVGRDGGWSALVGPSMRDAQVKSPWTFGLRDPARYFIYRVSDSDGLGRCHDTQDARYTIPD